MKIIYVLLISFSLNATAASILKFTGYKFTEKVGVSGVFESIEWKIPKNFKITEEMLKKISLKIDTWSIDAGNSARNTNIVNSLFKNWGDRYINAHAVKVDIDKKILVMNMTVGEKTNEISFAYNEEKEKVIFKGEIDLLKLGFKNAFSVLSETCKILHTGEDKVSKTWSTVDIEVVLDK